MKKRERKNNLTHPLLLYSAWSFSLCKNWQGFIHYTVHISFSVGTIRSTGQKEQFFFQIKFPRVTTVSSRKSERNWLDCFDFCWISHLLSRAAGLSFSVAKKRISYFLLVLSTDYWESSGQQQRPEQQALCDLTKKMWKFVTKDGGSKQIFSVKSQSAVQWIKSFDEKNRV